MMSRISRFIRFHFKRASKSAIVGAEGAVVQMIVTYVLTEFFGIWYLISVSIGILIAFAHNYFLNYYWAFRDVIRRDQ
ncbi:MAG: GtrA family protein [Candidatus Bathyarchaeota archaeon]|nr:GtrA family protein [Candidatus Bathyarchaeota archaeon]